MAMETSSISDLGSKIRMESVPQKEQVQKVVKSAQSDLSSMASEKMKQFAGKQKTEAMQKSSAMGSAPKVPDPGPPNDKNDLLKKIKK